MNEKLKETGMSFVCFVLLYEYCQEAFFFCKIIPKGYLSNDSIISNVSDIYKAYRSTQVIGGVTVSCLSPLIQDNKFVIRKFVVGYPDK